MRWAVGLMVVVLAACEGAMGSLDAGRDVRAVPGDTPPDSPVPCTASATPTRLVVTADFMGRSLSLFGLERVLDVGCSAEEARVGTIDLGSYAPGPVELEISPDGSVALVSIGPGFYEGSGAFLVRADPPPVAEGTLLVVDLAARTVLGEIELAAVPMGVAFAPDGARAYVAEYGLNSAPGSAVAVIDVAARSLVREIEVGSRPEEIALSSDGSVAAVSLSNGIVTFEVADPEGSMSPVLATGSDPSGVGFAVGTRTLFVTNSMSSSCSIVDATDPSAPSIVATPIVGGFPYGVTPLSGTEVLLTTSLREALVRVSTDPEIEPTSLALPYGGYLFGSAVVDGIAITAHPVMHVLSVVELGSGEMHAIRWLEVPGPTDVAITP